MQSYTPPPLTTININTTPITDGTNTGYLSSLIKRVDNDDKTLILDGRQRSTRPTARPRSITNMTPLGRSSGRDGLLAGLKGVPDGYG